jgi:hypothetical protein
MCALLRWEGTMCTFLTVVGDDMCILRVVGDDVYSERRYVSTYST